MNLPYPRRTYSILEVRKSMQRKYGVADELAIGRLVGYGDLIMEYKTRYLPWPRPNRYGH